MINRPVPGEQAFSREVLEIAERIKPLLAGKGPAMQTAVLAEMLGLVLAGHWIPGEPEQTELVREEVFKMFCALVREITPVSAKILGTDK